MIVAAGPRPTDRTWIGLPDLDDLVVITFVALIVWAAVWTARFLRVRAGGKQERPANLITLWLGLAVALAVMMANPQIVERLRDLAPTEPPEIDAEPVIEDETPAPVDFEITATQVYVALAALGAWMAVTVLSRRRDELESGVDDEIDETVDEHNLGRVIQGMVADLDVGSDPRSAVMTAYHRLEQALAEQGHPRRSAETPTEHLDRLLDRLSIDHTPFLDLARRYELARFSNEPITEADRDRAASDLARARDDLNRHAAR